MPLERRGSAAWDFSSTRSATSREGLTIDVKLSLACRPIVAELYALDVELGESYYDEVVGPEPLCLVVAGDDDRQERRVGPRNEIAG